MKTIVCNSEELFDKAAEHIAETIEKKADCVLALSYDRALSRLYSELVRICGQKELSLKKVTFFVVADFEDRPLIRERILHELIERTDAEPDNLLSADDSKIEEHGGIDLAVLNLGYKGQFGFNEPATPYSSLTHRQKLTESSLSEFAFLDEELPEYAYTMGVKTVTGARDIIVVASGEEKSDAVFGMLYGRDDSTIPAAFLQLPLNVEIFIDHEAASKL